MKRRKKYRKLSSRARALASKLIAEEVGKFPRRQAVAVGISRAVRQAEDEKVRELVRKYL